MQIIFEDEMKMKGFKNALEDGVKMNIWAYLALLPITHKNGGNTVFWYAPHMVDNGNIQKSII